MLLLLVESSNLDGDSANALLNLIKWLTFEIGSEIPIPNDNKLKFLLQNAFLKIKRFIHIKTIHSY